MATPTKFYKYTTAKTATTKWSSPTLFNDPFDMQFDLHLEYVAGRVVARVMDRFLDVYTGRAPPRPGSILDENAQLLRVCMPGLKEADVRKEHSKAIYGTMDAMAKGLPKLHDELRETLKPRRLLCLSEVLDSLLMWAHYADSYKGAVIEFSCIKEGSYASAWGAAKPVRYQTDMPRLADEDALVRSLMGRGRLATREQFEQTVYVKADAWAYEKEWRVLGGWENKAEGVEYIPFRRRELTAIYLGCRIDKADDEEIQKSAAKKYPHAKVHSCGKSAQKFALEFASTP